MTTGERPHARCLLACLPQLLQQRLRFDEVAGVEALGKPGVERREEPARLGHAPALGEPAGEARGRAELIHLRTLAARELDGGAEARFGLRAALTGEQLTT